MHSQTGSKDALREALEGQRALVVIDDPWTIDDADAFSVTAPPTRLLVTTRNNDVLVGIGAEEHRIGVLSPSDALKMLSEWVGKKPDNLPAEAAEVARECGYLPVALAMTGAMIRSKLSLGPTSSLLAWKDAVTRLRRADLEGVRRNFPGYPYPTLLGAIEVNILALEESDRERYLNLAVFPEDQPIPQEALRVLWNLDEVDTRDCMTRVAARSLATWATDGTSLILHDLQLDWIRLRREKNLPGLHLRLLEAWDALLKLPDAYAWRWVAYHLAKAGRESDLRRLLVNFDYLFGKLAATDVNALIVDYNCLPEDKDLQLLQSAIRLSANVVARDQRQLAGQLTGRLLGITNTDIEALLTQALEKAPRPWLRPLRANLTPPGGPLIRILEGHRMAVECVAITPDGRRAVSASGDHTLRVWDLESSQSVHTLQGHTAWVTGVAVAPNGRRAVSGSYDNTLHVWDLQSGQSVHTLQGHTDFVTGVAITPNGRRAVSASGDKTLRVWDLQSGQSVRTLQGHTDFVTGIAVAPDGRRAVSASGDRTLRVWDLESGQNVRTLQGHSDWVSGVAITPDGCRAVSASGDRTLRVWDLESGQSVRTLQGHTDSIYEVAIAPDGRRAVSASSDRTLRVWDLESGQSVRTLQGHGDWVTCVTITADGRRAVSASGDKTLRVWDLESAEEIASFTGESEMHSCAIAPDGQTIIAGDRSGRVHFLHLVEAGETKPAIGDTKIQLLQHKEQAS
jgi:WD40 repeat protein